MLVIPWFESERYNEFGMNARLFKTKYQGDIESKPFYYSLVSTRHVKPFRGEIKMAPNYDPLLVPRFFKAIGLAKENEEEEEQEVTFKELPNKSKTESVAMKYEDDDDSSIMSTLQSFTRKVKSLRKGRPKGNKNWLSKFLRKDSPLRQQEQLGTAVSKTGGPTPNQKQNLSSHKSREKSREKLDNKWRETSDGLEIDLEGSFMHDGSQNDNKSPGMALRKDPKLNKDLAKSKGETYDRETFSRKYLSTKSRASRQKEQDASNASKISNLADENLQAESAESSNSDHGEIESQQELEHINEVYEREYERARARYGSWFEQIERERQHMNQPNIRRAFSAIALIRPRTSGPNRSRKKTENEC